MRKPLPDYDQALATILRNVEVMPARTVALDEALGEVLCRHVVADRDQPPFDRAAMDGFAVRSSQVAAHGTFDVVGTVAAGAVVPPYPQNTAQVMRIATGAPVPDGADGVVPNEQAQEEQLSNAERVRFTVTSVQPWQNVHRRASDAKAGQTVIPAGTRLGAHHVGIAASVGAVQLEVAQRPRITLLTSGDEVRPPDTPNERLQPQQIRNSNRPMLASFFRALGTPPVCHEHVVDEPQPTLDAARRAIIRSDLVVTVGGVSVGRRDLLPRTWEQIGVEKVLHGVAIQPGKPVFVARDGKKLVVGLPGNPVSVLATAHLFVWPILRKMLGLIEPLPWRSVALSDPVEAMVSRQVFRAARCVEHGRAEVISWHGSGDLIHTAAATGFVRLPIVEGVVEAGTNVPYLPMVPWGPS